MEFVKIVAYPDTLSIAFLFLSVGASAVMTITLRQGAFRTIGATTALAIAYLSPSMLMLVVAYTLATFLAGLPRASARVGSPSPQHLQHLWGESVRLLQTLFPCGVLALAWANMWLHGTSPSFQAPAMAVEVNSFVFGCVLLATVTGSAARVVLASPGNSLLLSVAWLYPLIRFASVTPWNEGWHSATMLAGGAVVLWSAARVYTAPFPWLMQMHLGVALAGVGMGSGKGLIAACYAMLVVLILGIARHDQPLLLARPGWTVWLLAGIVPLTAPFASLWMAIDAAVAQGAMMLAAAFWGGSVIAALSLAVAVIDCKHSSRRHPLIPPYRAMSAAALSVVGGLAAPYLVRILVGLVLPPSEQDALFSVQYLPWFWVVPGTGSMPSPHILISSPLFVALLMLVPGMLAVLLQVGTPNQSGHR